MLKQILYSSFTKKVYDSIKNIRIVKLVLAPLANKASLSYLANTKQKLDQMSPSFVSANWLQSTLHLEIGETHSCHHPGRHKINLLEVLKDPKRLHNTKEKELFRAQMIAGEYPSECEYCWKVEKNNDYSDRIYKSSSDWGLVDFKTLTTPDKIKNVFPTYLEVSFSSDCNLKCAYCSPDVSSAIRSEITKFGPYPTSDQFGNLRSFEKSPEDLSLHFWRWWEEGLPEELKILRVTGGEPFLSKDTFKLIDLIKSGNKKYKFDFSINSNLMLSRELIKKTMIDLKNIVDDKKIRNFQLYVSIDTWGRHSEFLRHGLTIKKFIQNVELCVESFPELEMTFMITYQAFSPFQFNQLLEFILDLRKRYLSSRIKVSISNMLHPEFMSIFVLDKKFLPYIESNLKFMKTHQLSQKLPHGFSNFEIQHLERIRNAFMNYNETNKTPLEDLRSFITEYEKRKTLNFSEVFSDAPDLVEFVKREYHPVT